MVLKILLDALDGQVVDYVGRFIITGGVFRKDGDGYEIESYADDVKTTCYFTIEQVHNLNCTYGCTPIITQKYLVERKNRNA